ncbi:hypothetical protein DPMN_028543 [Dreissena polymorpha]|uniref:Uncharacterized protein n=1 Tax=Dreissena polymorpha TaxID=45954 RepID=A0A9D4LX42_DREPO|nr:hypothetical protein DPMN_028543 [Dreissena polymorpha]
MQTHNESVALTVELMTFRETLEGGAPGLSGNVLTMTLAVWPLTLRKIGVMLKTYSVYGSRDLQMDTNSGYTVLKLLILYVQKMCDFSKPHQTAHNPDSSRLPDHIAADISWKGPSSGQVRPLLPGQSVGQLVPAVASRTRRFPL